MAAMSPNAIAPPLPVRALVALCVLNHVALSGARLALVEQALRLGVPPLGAGTDVRAVRAGVGAGRAAARALGRPHRRALARARGHGADDAGARPRRRCGRCPRCWRPRRAPIGLGYTASLIALQAEIARGRDEAARRAGFAAFAVGTAASSGFGPFLAGQLHGACRRARGVRRAGGSSVAASLRARRRGRRACIRRRRRRAAHRAVARLAHAAWARLRRLMLADLGMALAWNANGFVVPLVAQRPRLAGRRRRQPAGLLRRRGAARARAAACVARARQRLGRDQRARCWPAARCWRCCRWWPPCRRSSCCRCCWAAGWAARCRR